DANAKAMTAVMAALKAAGIAERDVQTSQLSLEPVRKPDGGADTPVIGFRATNQIDVMIRKITSIADVIDTAIKAGANNLGGIEFVVENPGPLIDKARPAAIADAKRKAEIYAKAAGVNVGRVVNISETGAAPPPAMFRSAAVAAPATP